MGTPRGLGPPAVSHTLGDGEMGHDVVRRGAVPMLLVRVSMDDVARTDGENVLAAGLREPDALGHIEGLPQGVRVPGRAGTGGEVDGVHPHPGWLLAACDD